MVFTGYEKNEISDKEMTVFFDYTDIPITGRYDHSKQTLNHQWIGSTNQQILFLSDHYKSYKIQNSNYVEVSIDDNGSPHF